MSKQQWTDTALAKALERGKERKSFTSTSDFPVERLSTPEDVHTDYETAIGYPGQYPFTRGVQPTMYRGKLWTMRQYAGFSTAEESNRRYKYLLEQGQTGLSVAFDLPTQIGYDSDDPVATGEIGRVGVAIDSMKDMEILFDGIPMDKVSTSMTINAPAAILLAFYIAAAEKQGVPPDKLQGTIQNDILKEYSARGTYIFPPAPSMRLVTNLFAYCSANTPQWNTISISGYHMREAGCTAAQEIAFTLADGIAYVEAALKAGMDVDDFAGRLAFFYASHNNLLEEVAKFRAARRLWAKIMKERFRARKERSMMMRFHTQTAGCTLTAQQPDNNIVRVAVQSLAAVLGGTQSLHTNSKDEALALPSEETVRIALRTQQIIACESGVADTIDPLAGSYYVESLTDRLQEKAEAYIARIDDMGGAVKAIELGFIQREITESAYEYQKAVETKEQVVVGQNQFIMEKVPVGGLLTIDPETAAFQVRKVTDVRKNRDNAAAREKLAVLRAAAATDDTNLMPLILDCARIYCTEGEICNELRAEFGEYRATEVL
ncbi:MAG: methylmalonyl-CoA mutase family protein [Clostridiales Family XIII bacterium]|jgi:methylmalonyl-CoA mutase N-terminal domain/subunit|nr:methylmalonyl-CoA mutase family protein [Clostridiales Family XIII bacterium]